MLFAITMLFSHLIHLVTSIFNKDDSSNHEEFLLESVKQNNLEDVKYHISKGAKNHLAIIYSAANGNLEILKYLIENNYDPTITNNLPLRIASSHGHLHIIEYLIKECNVNVRACQNNALIVAVENNHLDIVKFLVKSGADIYTNNCEALKIAEEKNHKEIIQYILDIDEQNDIYYYL